MREFLITLLILLFDLSINNGHSLSKIELNNPTNLYEMNEDKSSLSITYPKDDKQILREIVYYHIIERPYEANDNVNKVTEAPDVDNIKRSFTNGHGFQYLDHIDDPKIDNNDDEELSLIDEEQGNDATYDDTNHDKFETTTETNSAEELENENDDEELDETTHDGNDNELIDSEQATVGNDTINLDVRFGEVDNKIITEEPGVTQEYKESRRKREIDYTNLPDAPSLPEFKMDILPDYIKSILLEEPFQKIYQDANKEDDFEEEIEKQVRSLEKEANHPPSVENDDDQKRGTKTYGMSLAGDAGAVWNDLNVTPVSYYVGELDNYHSISIPEEVLGTTTIVPIDESSQEPDDQNNEEESTDDFENDAEIDDEAPISTSNKVKIDIRFGEVEIPSTGEQSITQEIHPIPYQAENFEADKEKQLKNFKKSANLGGSIVSKTDHKREVKTYGMSLSGDDGIVWNDLNAPLIAYHVGEPENDSSTSKPEELLKTTTIATTDKSTNETNIDEVEEEEQLDDNMEQNFNSEDVDEETKIEESFDAIKKIFEELIKNTTGKPVVTTETTKKPDSQEDITGNEPTETPTKKPIDNYKTSTPKPHKENGEDTKDSSGNNKPNEEKIPNGKDKNNESTKHKNDDTKQQQFVQELIKNKYFWRWLEESSTTYLDIMTKKIDILIKSEVENQLKQYLEEHKNIGNCKPDHGNENKTLEENPDKISNSTDVDENINTTEAPIVTTTEPNKPSNDTIYDDVGQNNNRNNTEKEDLGKKHTNKDTDDKKADTPIRIEAQNIYGSSVGNGRVTNIFIFNISKTTDLDKFKPLTNGTDDVYVFGLSDKKNDQQNVEKDKISCNKTKTDEGNLTSTDKPVISNNKTTNFNETTPNPNIVIGSTTTTVKITTEVTEPPNDLNKDVTKKATTEIIVTEIPKDTVTNSTITPKEIEITTTKPPKDREINSPDAQKDTESKTTKASKDKESNTTITSDIEENTTDKISSTPISDENKENDTTTTSKEVKDTDSTKGDVDNKSTTEKGESISEGN